MVAAPAFQRILARLAPVLEIQPVNDDYAFAQFMSAFREKEELQLAIALEGVIAPEPMEPSDQVAKLLSELGP